MTLVSRGRRQGSQVPSHVPCRLLLDVNRAGHGYSNGRRQITLTDEGSCTILFEQKACDAYGPLCQPTSFQKKARAAGMRNRGWSLSPAHLPGDFISKEKEEEREKTQKPIVVCSPSVQWCNTGIIGTAGLSSLLWISIMVKERVHCKRSCMTTTRWHCQLHAHVHC